MKKLASLCFAAVGVLSLGLVSCTSDEAPPVVTTTDTTVNQSVDTAFFAKISFSSLDGLEVTADQYHIDSTKPLIILCHQAQFSRGEYKDIAPMLNDLGFNCIALDQRSGSTAQGIKNETADRARAAGKGQTFMDAEQDVIAAVNEFSAAYNTNVILWGSSYSSALALKVASENDKVERVLSFSPGEYLVGVNMQDVAEKVMVPAFLTSSRAEQAQTKAIFDKIPGTDKKQFTPKGDGRHGSSALWPTEKDQAEYWDAVKLFLGV